MGKELRAVQVILGLMVVLVVFYLLKEVDYYGAAGIGVLWGIATYLGIQALNEWGMSRKAKAAESSSDAHVEGSLAKTHAKKHVDSPYPIKEWTSIKSSVYVLKLNLEDIRDTEERKKLASDCMSILKRYEDMISTYGDKIPEDEKLDVLKDLKFCSSMIK